MKKNNYLVTYSDVSQSIAVGDFIRSGSATLKNTKRVMTATVAESQVLTIKVPGTSSRCPSWDELSYGPQPFGVWGAGAFSAADESYLSYYRGWEVVLRWSNIERTADTFSFAAFDTDLQTLANAGKFISFMVWVGPDSPTWLYNNTFNVPNFTNSINTYPYYFDATYQTRFFNMLDNVAAHIKTLSPAIRDKIIFWQSAEGSTGDEGPYKGTVPSGNDVTTSPANFDFTITDTQWRDFQRQVWTYMYAKLSGSNVRWMVNPGNDESNFPWALSNAPTALHKSGEDSHDYAYNTEYLDFSHSFADEDPYTVAQPSWLRKRGELPNTNTRQWFIDHYKWNLMSIAQSALTKRLDMWNLDTSTIDVLNGDLTTINFYNRLAAEQDPAKAAYAWIGLAKRFDGSDIVLFPVAQYGNVFDNTTATTSATPSNYIKHANLTRLQNIQDFTGPAYGTALDLSQFGASAPTSATNQRDFDKESNDIGMLIWTENYGRFLYQLNPDSTSNPCYRVGNSSTDNYGRYCKTFKTHPGKMYFWLDPAMSSSFSNDVDFEIVYFDTGSETWWFSCSTFLHGVTNTNTKGWKSASFNVPDFRFGKLGGGGSDFVLSGSKTLFATIQFHNNDRGYSPPQIVTQPPPTSTTWGSSAFGTDLNVNQKIALGANLSTNIIRVSVQMIDYQPNNPQSENFLWTILNDFPNMKVALNANWDSGTNRIFVNGSNVDVYVSRFTSLLNTYASIIKFIVVENEPDNANYFVANESINPTSFYIEQVRRAIIVAHSFNIPIADGGLHAGSVSGGPNTRSGQIVAAYTNELSALDYCNIHIYYPRDTQNDINNAADYLNANKSAAQRIISNECGIKDRVDQTTIIPQQATDLVNILTANDFRYAIINAAGPQGDTGIAKPFNDIVNGVQQVTPNANGDAFIQAIA